ncbi:MAG: YncE family protein [Candidatus Hydrothermae bacterium]|nr:YncE family protein [Candidatus Hydrothermae bacterium]
MKKWFLVGLLALTACSEKEETGMSSAGNRIYVLQGISETVSIYDIDNDTLLKDVFITGNTPNYLVFHGDHGYIVNSGFTGDASITLFDPSTNKEITDFPLPAGSNPYAAAVANDRLFVTLFLKNMVYVLDCETGDPIDSIPVKSGPEGIISANGAVYVACTGIQPDYSYSDAWVLKIDPETPDVIDSLKVGINVQALAVDSNGRLHALSTGDYSGREGVVYVIDPDGLILLDSVLIGGYPGNIAINGDDIAYLVDWNLGLLSYDAGALTIIHGTEDPIQVGTGSMGIDVDGENRIYVTLYSASDTNWMKVISGDSILTTINLGTAVGASALRFRPAEP